MKLRLAQPGDAGGHRPARRPARASATRATTWRSAGSPATTTSTTTRVAKQHCPLIAYTAGPGGRPPGAPPRHDRRLAGARRPGVRPAHDLPRPRRRHRGAGRRAASGRSTRPDFFNGFFDTALAEDEIITEIRVPKTGGAGWSYLKFRQRALDWATVGVAAVVGASNGSIQGARVGADQHGPDPAARVRPPRRRSGGRPATRCRRRRRAPTRAPTRRATPGRARTTAATWPGCSPGAPWRRRCRDDADSGRAPVGPAGRGRVPFGHELRGDPS